MVTVIVFVIPKGYGLQERRSMTYSQKYKQELQEATELQRRLQKEYDDFRKQLDPLTKEDKKRFYDLIDLRQQIQRLKHELRQAWFEESFDEDGMYMPGINAQVVK